MTPASETASQRLALDERGEETERRVDLSPLQRRLWRLGSARVSPFHFSVVAVEASDHSMVAGALDALRSTVEQVHCLRMRLAAEQHRDLPFWEHTDGVDLRLLPDRNWHVDAPCDLLNRIAQDAADRIALPALFVQQCRRDDETAIWILAADGLRCDARGLHAIAALWMHGHAGSPLQRNAPDFAGVVRWQSKLADAPEASSALGYWQRHLAAGPQGTVLPPVVSGAAIEEVAIDVGDEIAALADRCGARHVSILLSAWLLLLGRVTGEDRVLVGIGHDGRPNELAGAIGRLHQPLPLAMSLIDDEPFGELVAKVARALSMHHRLQMSFRHDGPALPERRDESLPPTFPFQFDGYALVQDGEMVTRSGWTGGEPFFLKLCIESCGVSGDHARLLYDSDAIRGVQAEALASALKRLLHGLVTGSSARTIDLFRDAAGRALRASDQGPPRADWQQPDRLGDLLCRHATFDIVEHGPSLQGAMLDRVSRRAEALLVDFGLTPRQAIAIRLPSSAEALVTFLAALRAGLVIAYVDPAWPEQRQAEAIGLAEVRLVISEQGDGTFNAPEVDLDQLKAREAHRGGIGAVECSGNEDAYVVFTSGSSGRPKAVLVSRRALQNQLLWLQEQIALGASDRLLLRTRLGFDAALWEVFLPALAGCAVVVPEADLSGDPSRLIEEIRRSSVTVIQVVPSLLRQLIDHPEFADCASLRTVACGGDRLSNTLAAAFAARMKCTLLNLYGPTECCIQIAAAQVDLWRAGRDSVSVGPPMANSGMHILTSRLEPTLDGHVGELFVSGAPLADGYLGDPAATSASFLPAIDLNGQGERMYRTGDLARRLSDGGFEILGRVDRQVKVNGQRVDLGEIEARLEAASQISQAFAMAVTDGDGAGHLAVAIASDVAPDVLEAQARSLLERTLPSQSIPSQYMTMPQLPLTERGKVDEVRLREMAENVTATPVRPMTETERAVADVWRLVLKRNDFGVDDNFFVSGGHSLLFAQTIIRLREKYGVAIALKAIFERPTIAGLASHIDGLLVKRGSGSK